MMPPKNRNSNWILWWLILVPTAVVIGKHMYDPVITLGEIIALGIAVPAIFIGIYKIIVYFLYRHRPFTMQYQKEHRFDRDRIIERRKTIPVGETQLLLRIQPKRPTVFEEVHLRLVDNKNPDSNFPSRNILGITKLEGIGLLGNRLMSVQEDHTNGLQGRYETSYHRAPEDSLFLVLTINASEGWSGYVMFKSTRFDGRRGFAYLPLQIEDTKKS